MAGLLVASCQSPASETRTHAAAKTQADAPGAEPSVVQAPVADKKQTDGPPLRDDGTVFAGAEQMGTRVTVKVWVGPGQTPAQAGTTIEEAFAEIERIEDIASEWRPHSELSQLNGRAGQDLAPMSPDLYTILARSKQIAAASNGAFDPTFHGIGQLWSFAPGAQPPPRATIEEHLKLVNWRELELVAGTPDPAVGAKGRLRQKGMKVGLGAIAKGYAVDRASDVLKRHGFG
ncbi:MAG: FAD:protein FMN transferase, partial [Nannocystaceae bacterium]